MTERMDITALHCGGTFIRYQLLILASKYNTSENDVRWPLLAGNPR